MEFELQNILGKRKREQQLTVGQEVSPKAEKITPVIITVQVSIQKLLQLPGSHYLLFTSPIIKRVNILKEWA